jgi:hypothetical protein
MMKLETRELISAIEEYRKAYMAHRDITFYKKNKYSPLVIQNHTTNVTKGPIFTVSLCDTWVELLYPGRISLGKQPVPHSTFSSTTLQLALEELLNFTRIHFMDDKLFNKITN